MKIVKSLALIFLLASVVVYTGCRNKKKKDPVPNAFKLQADKFVGSWALAADGAVLESTPDANYNGLTLLVTGDENGGTVETNIGSLTNTSTRVWPAQSDWVFSSSTGDVNNPSAQYVLRQADNVVIGITVTNEELELTFLVPQSTSRLMGIEGNWTFTFEPV